MFYITLTIFFLLSSGEQERRDYPWYGSFHECLLFWQQAVPTIKETGAIPEDAVVTRARCSVSGSSEKIG